MSTIDLTIIAVYLLGMILVGLYFQKKASSSIDSYFLGGRKIPWWVLGASGMASNFDVTGTMINTALIFALGVSGFFIELRGGICLIMAFLLAFMGKWNRRAQVMTIAEWMHFRFGTRKDGDLARIIGAVSQIIMTIAMVTYFSVGAGKFVAEFFSIPGFLGMEPRFVAALILISLSLIYTVASGLYGVVWTDVFQSLFVFFTLITISYLAFTKFILPEVFNVSYPLRDGGFELVETTKAAWTNIKPSWKLAFPATSDYSIYNYFGVAIFFYFIKVLLEGSGGASGYMVQRYFAARDDRDAGLLSAFWIFLLSFRWLFIAAIAIMGISYFNNPENSIVAAQVDPEAVLPIVIKKMIPVGLKGFLMAGLLAAAMSTFDSTINAGASYWVKDIYQAFINPKASEKTLLWHGRLASVGIVVIGLLFSITIRNINEIWGWITMSIGAGLFIPFLARWYWSRMNGYGFSAGVLGGMISAILQKIIFPDIPEYIAFFAVNSITVIILVAVTLLTPPTEEKVLENFFNITKPFGLWKKFRNKLSIEKRLDLKKEHRQDLLTLVLAVPWQLSLFLMWMALIMRTWGQFIITLALTVGLAIALYFIWYKNLKKES
jgi:solute:Na+ symporter, SSS family